MSGWKERNWQAVSRPPDLREYEWGDGSRHGFGKQLAAWAFSEIWYIQPLLKIMVGDLSRPPSPSVSGWSGIPRRNKIVGGLETITRHEYVAMGCTREVPRGNTIIRHVQKNVRPSMSPKTQVSTCVKCWAQQQIGDSDQGANRLTDRSKIGHIAPPSSPGRRDGLTAIWPVSAMLSWVCEDLALGARCVFLRFLHVLCS